MSDQDDDDTDDVTANALTPLMGPRPAALAPLPSIGLTDEQDVVFCIEYARTGDPLLAVMKSRHWAPNVATQDQLAERILARPDIQRGIEAAKRLQNMAAAAQVTPEVVDQAAWDLYVSAREVNKISEATNALRLLSMRRGYLVDRKEISHTLKVEEVDEQTLVEIALRGKQKVIEGDFEEVKEDGE